MCWVSPSVFIRDIRGKTGLVDVLSSLNPLSVTECGGTRSTLKFDPIEKAPIHSEGQAANKYNPMNTKPPLTGTAGPGSVAGRSSLTRISVLLPLLLLLALPGLAQAQFDYFVEDGAVIIAGYSGSGGEVDIPDTIDGLPVVRIAAAAFYFCRSLTSVTIPDNVTSIGNDAFYSCSKLTRITMGNSISSIGEMAFTGCIALRSITIPDSVISIGSGAFIRCSGLTTVTIPSRVTYIGTRVFSECSNLTGISVDDSNPAYSGEDGVLFDKKQITLIQCPPGKTGGFWIPDSVSKIGYLAFEDCKGLTSVRIPDGVTEILDSTFASCSGLTALTIGNGVTSIGARAFHLCSGLINVVIPDSVTSIGWGAFSECTDLMSISIPDSVTSIGAGAFSSCVNLTDMFIPESVISIGGSAFSGCTAMTSVTIGDGVITIGGDTFGGCISLTDVKIGKSVTTITGGAFSGCVSLASITIPDSVTSIGGNAFDRCSSLTEITVDALNPVYSSVDGVLFDKSQSTLIRCPEGKPGEYTIPSTVMIIGNSAFENCPSLTSVTIPDSVTGLGSRAFAGCSGLINVTVGDAVTTIGEYAFGGCNSLADVTIGTSVTAITGGAFSGCVSLTSVTLPDSVTSIDGNAFDGCSNLTAITVDTLNPIYSSVDGVLFDKSQFTLIRCPEGREGHYTIPHTVTSIANSAFEDCSGLTSVTIRDRVTGLAYLAFAGCARLTSVTIGESVASIEDSAFQDCTSLSSVRIPDSVTSIGWRSFGQCSSLTNVTFGNGLVLLGGGTFEGCGSLMAAYFEGNAPSMDGFISTDAGKLPYPPFYAPVLIFYRPGRLGWGSEFSGRPTVPWGVVWGSPVRGDMDGDEVVDRNDLSLVVASRNQHAVDSEDPRDLDGDGMITVLDARIVVTLFTVPAGFTRVATSPEGVVVEWNENACGMTLQSTSDIHSGAWQIVEGLHSSTNAVIGNAAERMFFRLVLPE